MAEKQMAVCHMSAEFSFFYKHDTHWALNGHHWSYSIDCMNGSKDERKTSDSRFEYKHSYMD